MIISLTFSWLSSDCVSFSLLFLNLISTFHNQSKKRRRNSSYEKYNTSWYIFPFYLLFYSFFLISYYEINYTKLFYSNFWTVSHLLIFFEKDSPLHPRLNKFPGWIDCKATYKAKGAASTLKRLETWRETNAPLWLLIGCIIFPIHENTIIYNYSDWTYHFFHVCKTL